MLLQAPLLLLLEPAPVARGWVFQANTLSKHRVRIKAGGESKPTAPSGAGLHRGDKGCCRLQKQCSSAACWCRPRCWSLAKAWSKPLLWFWVNDWVATKSRASGGIGVEGTWQRRAQTLLRTLPWDLFLFVTAVGLGVRLSRRQTEPKTAGGSQGLLKDGEKCKVSSLRTCLCPKHGLGTSFWHSLELGLVLWLGWRDGLGLLLELGCKGAAKECLGDRRISPPGAVHVGQGWVFWDKPRPRVFVRV